MKLGIGLKPDKSCKQKRVPSSASLLFVYSSPGQQATDADNTKHNSSQENKNTDTAEKQSNSKEDLSLTQKIRQTVMKEGSLSMDAKNVKIIARDGNVTLKGPVDSQQEKDTIGTKAGEIAGKNKVDNRIEVKAKSK